MVPSTARPIDKAARVARRLLCARTRRPAAGRVRAAESATPKPPMNATEIVRNAPGAAIATSGEGRILELNGAAKELLGYRRRAIVGRPVQDLMQVREASGDRPGSGKFAFYDLVAKSDPVGEIDFKTRRAYGETLTMSVSVVVLPCADQDDYELVLQLQPKLRRRRTDRAIEQILAGAGGRRPDRHQLRGRCADQQDLTPRQRQILRLLAQGQRPTALASQLGISPATARAHIKRICRRLGARGQLEAVAVAFRERLI